MHQIQEISTHILRNHVLWKIYTTLHNHQANDSIQIHHLDPIFLVLNVLIQHLTIQEYFLNETNDYGSGNGKK